jgi:hypothetical protein
MLVNKKKQYFIPKDNKCRIARLILPRNFEETDKLEIQINYDVFQFYE